MRKVNVFNWLLTGSLIFLVACGSGGGGSNPNQAPVANAGADKAVDEQTLVTLEGSGTDAEGSITFYRWDQLSGQTVTLSDSSVARPTFTAPVTKESIGMEFRLTVTDEDGETGTDIVLIAIDPVNTLPTAEAGDAQSVNENTTVTLAGSATDVDGTISSYSWTQISGTTVTLSDANVAAPTFTAPQVSASENLEFELTVEDDEGGQATDQVTVQVSPVTVALTIQGKVTDGPIANATVTATIEDAVFTTSTDENGDYTLNIALAEELQENLVVLTATGSAEQANVKLLSMPGVFTDLVNAAGGDETLVRSENHLVDVTHMSTAVTGLLSIANANELPQTIAEINQAMPLLSGDEVLNAAVLVKLVVDYSATNAALSLPTGVTDTFALVSDFDSLVAYKTGINTEALQALFDEALAATLDDSNLYADSMSLPEFYTWLADYGLITGDKLVFNNSENTGNYIHSNDFFGASTGVLQGFDIVSDPAVSLELEGSVVFSNTEFLEVNGIFQSVTVETIHDKIELRLIASSADADLVSYRLFERKHYPNGEFVDELTDFTSVRTLAKSSSPLTEAELVGEVMLPVKASLLNSEEVISTSFGDVDTSTTINGDAFDLFANGTVSTDISGLGSGSWSLNEGALAFDFAEVNLVVKKLRDTTVEVTATNGSGEFLGFVVGEFALKNTAWTQESVAGVYELTWEFFDPFNRLWLELEADSSGVQVSTIDSNSNGQLEADEFFVSPVTWRLEDGNVIVERYRSLSGSCEALEPDCYVYNRRTIDLFAIEGDRYFATNRHEFNFAPLNLGQIDPELTNPLDVGFNHHSILD